MLEDSLFESQGRGKTRKPFTMAIAVVAHAVTITGLVLIPLLQTQAITLPPINLPLLVPRANVFESAVPLVPAQPHIQWCGKGFSFEPYTGLNQAIFKWESVGRVKAGLQ